MSQRSRERRKQRRKLIRGMRTSIDLLLAQRPGTEMIRRILNLMDAQVTLLEAEIEDEDSG